MRPAVCFVTPEGYPSIFLTALAALVFALLGWPVPALAFLLLCWFCVNFFRDPERVVPEGGDAVSPADGKVVKIEERPDPLDGERKTCVCIFMNVFNVHVNRAPQKGRIESIRYHAGKFLNASLDKASEDNERCAYRLVEEDGSAWTFVQIAGLVARRIVCRAERGDLLEKGQRFGMIRFGSRVDLYLPDGYSPAVHCGDKVLAGQSVVARRA